MCLEGPGGAFIDQCKHWSIQQFAPSPARRKQQNLSISAKRNTAHWGGFSFGGGKFAAQTYPRGGVIGRERHPSWVSFTISSFPRP